MIDTLNTRTNQDQANASESLTLVIYYFAFRRRFLAP